MGEKSGFKQVRENEDDAGFVFSGNWNYVGSWDQQTSLRIRKFATGNLPSWGLQAEFHEWYNDQRLLSNFPVIFDILIYE